MSGTEAALLPLKWLGLPITVWPDGGMRLGLPRSSCLVVEDPDDVQK